jgi:hypothetical protein
MGSKLTVLTTAAALALGLTAAANAASQDAKSDEAPGAKSDITIVGTESGNAPATGVEQSGEGQGATNQSTENAGAPAGTAEGPSTGAEPGAGIEDSAQGEGATTGQDDVKEGKLPSSPSTY